MEKEIRFFTQAEAASLCISYKSIEGDIFLDREHNLRLVQNIAVAPHEYCKRLTFIYLKKIIKDAEKALELCGDCEKYIVLATCKTVDGQKDVYSHLHLDEILNHCDLLSTL